MLPNRGLQRQTEYHGLLHRIRQLESEIAVLSRIDDAHSSRPAEAGTFDRSMQHFRVELANTAAQTKRRELEAMKAEAADMLARDPKVALPLPPPKAPGPPRKRPPLIVVGIIVVVLAGLAVAVATGKLGGAPTVAVSSTMLAPTLEQRVETIGDIFYVQQMPIRYSGGTVTLSGDPGPTGTWSVDDRMELTVTHEDKTTATWGHLFNGDCERNEVLGPQDVTSLFASGANTVAITLYDACGGAAGTSGPVLLTIH